MLYFVVVEGRGERITVTVTTQVMRGIITASFSLGCVTHSSVPLISVLFWLTCGIAVQPSSPYVLDVLTFFEKA